jgi:hypothetical protein
MLNCFVFGHDWYEISAFKMVCAGCGKVVDIS